MIISQLEKGERIVKTWHNVRFAHSSACTICDKVMDLQEVLSHDLKYLCSKSITDLPE